MVSVNLQGFSGTYVGEYIKDTGSAEEFNVGEYWVDVKYVQSQPFPVLPPLSPSI